MHRNPLVYKKATVRVKSQKFTVNHIKNGELLELLNEGW